MISMEEIGGYFELELQKRSSYHKELIALNTGRNAFEYILNIRKYNHVYIPYFTCDAILEPLQKLKIKYDFYSINNNLEVILSLKKIELESGFLYTNYFGIKSNYIKHLVKQLPNLIVDASQSFFYKPQSGVDTFYSPRKFFGLPDGGYVSCAKRIDENFEEDISVNRFSHLLMRLDKSGEEGFNDFKKNNKLLSNQPIKKMSASTKALLNSIDYKMVLKKRNENFRYLHHELKRLNDFKSINEDNINGPMAYPFITKSTDLRRRLIENKIYIPTYWPNVSVWVGKESIEYNLCKQLLSLPIDQRYGNKEMDKIIKIITSL